MRGVNLLLTVVCVLWFGCRAISQSQTKSQEEHSVQDTSKPNVIALSSGSIEEIPYDAGTIRFLATSKETKGAYSLFELKERPGYKTAWHRHNNYDEAFYVMEGILTVKINDKVANYPAGSYILIPRGTPHGQANVGTVPTRVLLNFTPSAYEQFFWDRVELAKTMKPDNPAFTDKFNELRRKHAQYVEILGTWEIDK